MADAGSGKKIDKAVDNLSEVIQAFAQSVDERFDIVEQRLDRIDERLESLIGALDRYLIGHRSITLN